MAAPVPNYTYYAQVMRVIDADTYDTEIDVGFRMFARLPLRVAHIDAPEAYTPEGKHATARELLGPIYGWFTEGFDTADLQEAKALLEALA